MIKILSNNQIREADKVTVETEGITSAELMERAANGCANWLKNQFDPKRPFVIVAGVGNNGGDALVIARRLVESGYQVSTYVIRYSEKFSKDFQINFERLEKIGHEINYVLESSQFPSISSDSVIVDGIFGSGLSRPTEGLALECIELINASIAEVVAIDIPSGMFGDKKSMGAGNVVEATHTLCFQSPRLAFLLSDSGWAVGNWHVIDIGLDRSFVSGADSSYFFVDSVLDILPMFRREKFDHKGRFGHALLLAGSAGKIGAAVLCAKAALRAGVGLLTAHVPKIGYDIIQTSIPEAMCHVDDNLEVLSSNLDTSKFDAVGIGPGIGTHKKTKRVLRSLLKSSQKPIILDADAVNILAEFDDPQKLLNRKCLLTPHVGEFDRLFGECDDAFHRLELLQKKAIDWDVHILLKGAYSALATPEGVVYFNSTGNPGMAKGGSGDALTGIVTALIAQCGDLKSAAIFGMYLHGLAGDIAALDYGQKSMITTDLIDCLGDAFEMIEQER